MNHDAPVIHVVFFGHFKAAEQVVFTNHIKPGCIILALLPLCSKDTVIISFKHSNQCDHIPKVQLISIVTGVYAYGAAFIRFIKNLCDKLCVIRQLILAYNIIAGQFPGSFFLLLCCSLRL